MAARAFGGDHLGAHRCKRDFTGLVCDLKRQR